MNAGPGCFVVVGLVVGTVLWFGALLLSLTSRTDPNRQQMRVREAALIILSLLVIAGWLLFAVAEHF